MRCEINLPTKLRNSEYLRSVLVEIICRANIIRSIDEIERIIKIVSKEIYMNGKTYQIENNFIEINEDLLADIDSDSCKFGLKNDEATRSHYQQY